MINIIRSTRCAAIRCASYYTSSPIRVFVKKEKSQPIRDAYSTNAISGWPRVDRTPTHFFIQWLKKGCLTVSIIKTTNKIIDEYCLPLLMRNNNKRYQMFPDRWLKASNGVIISKILWADIKCEICIITLFPQ